MNEYEEVLEIAEKLREYYDLQMDSMSEAVQTLCHLSSYPDYLSDEVYAAVVKEMRAQLKNYEENCEIVEIEDTITRSFVELRWNDE